MRKITLLMCLLALSLTCAVAGNTIPVKILNNSQGQFSDSEIYVAILGRYGDRSIYYDLPNNSQNNAALRDLNDGVNSLTKAGAQWGFANVFTKLSDIRDRTIHMDHTYACRMFISFRSPMYLHAFADGGYAGADLQNPTDPNAGIRWELIEFTYNDDNNIWINTTRVDAFQYPMGLEVYAPNTYLKRGELVKYEDIISRWNSWYGSSQYAACMQNIITTDGLGGVIFQPSKVASVKNSGIFDAYINQIWDYFRNNDMTVSMGVLGTWKGRVNGNNFVLTCQSGNYWQPGSVANVEKPSTTDAIEGAGTFAKGTDIDKTVQAMFCGAMNRGVIQLTSAAQDWSPTGSNYFNTNTCNEYVKFFHQTDFTHLGLTYAFAYDDTFDQSATCHCNSPEHVTVTIGGFVNGGGEGGNGDGNGGNGGGGSSVDPTTIPAAPAPAVAAANVKSIFSGSYTSITPNMFNGSWGQATSAQNVYCSGDEAYQWTNFNYMGIQLTGDDSTVNVGDMETLHMDFYPLSDMDINIYPIALNPTDDSKKATKHLTANQWNSFDIPLSDFGGLDFSRLGQFKFDGGSGQTLFVDNIYFYKGNGGGNSGTIPAAPVPSHNAANVKAIYSNSYSCPTLSIPDWANQWLKTSDGGLTRESLNGNEALHLKTFNFAAYNFSSAINANGMDYLHLDVYPVNAEAVTVHPNGSEAVFVSTNLTAGRWNGIDIPLSAFAGFDFSNVGSIKFTGLNGADADGTKDLYIDNVYFFSGAPSGIRAVSTDQVLRANIYGMDGRLVKRNATSTEGLSKGIYIVNGRKIVVK